MNSIVRAAIFPPIGIARIGNSKAEPPGDFFVGPEVPDSAVLPAGQHKDAMGALKRQAARFRIYGFDADDKVVAELTADNAVIEWSAHLANTKAAWYQFHLALDIPEADAPSAAISKRRNAAVPLDQRGKLVIDGGTRRVQGRSISGHASRFDEGRFFHLEVPLGELRTDDAGRLLVLGGLGVARSIVNQPPMDFANNDGWHDDVSDGPVDASVKIDGRSIPVEGAWVVVAPPNYAPALKTTRTLYDLVYDCMINWGLLPAPTQVSFEKHIRPIFERLSGLQWVNQGFASFFGSGTPFDVAPLLTRISDASDGNREFRERMLAQFRSPARSAQRLGKLLWPQFYGDALDSLRTPSEQDRDPSTKVPQGLASLSGQQLGWLQKWATGDFVNDLDQLPRFTSLGQVPLADQPHALTEAALCFCLADAFHPGCELTWPMRIRTLYSSPFRILRRSADSPEPDYGDVMSPDIALSSMGPLNGAAPGDLTRWMAIPWQTDTASCLSGYSFFRTSPSLPTFWPARVPNDVLREADYVTVMDKTQPIRARMAAFYRREDWFRVFVGGTDVEQMVTEFDKLGLVEERPGPMDLPGVPGKLWVEGKPALPDPLPVSTSAGLQGARPAAARPASRRGKLRRFGPRHS